MVRACEDARKRHPVCRTICRAAGIAGYKSACEIFGFSSLITLYDISSSWMHTASTFLNYFTREQRLDSDLNELLHYLP